MRAEDVNFWPSSPDDDFSIVSSGDDDGAQVVKLLPASFEGIISEFESELGVGSWMVSVLTNDVYWSEGTYRIHDVAPGTPLGLESALSYFAPEDVEYVRSVVEEGLRCRKDYQFEATLISETGRRKRVRSHGRYVERDSVPVLMGIIRLIDQPD